MGHDRQRAADAPLDPVVADARPIGERLVRVPADLSGEPVAARAGDVADHPPGSIGDDRWSHARRDRRVGDRIRGERDPLRAKGLEPHRCTVDVDARLPRDAAPDGQVGRRRDADVAGPKHDPRDQRERLAGVVDRQPPQQRPAEGAPGREAIGGAAGVGLGRRGNGGRDGEERGEGPDATGHGASSGGCWACIGHA